MNYEIGWLSQAEEELGNIWSNSDNREEIDHATDSLERQLEIDAMDVGESREANMRIAFEPPLSIWFWVNEQAKRVLVVHIREYR